MIRDAEFFLPGGRSGVLLIHGLTGTPNEMRIVGRGLNKAGFTVYGMQLAGHCGNAQDLLQTGWQDWYASVEKAAARLQQDVDHLFVAGLSMGALLALRFAALQAQTVRGVGVYGPTFRYDGWSMPAHARHLFFLLVWFKRLGIFQDRSFVEHPPYGLKDERIRATISASMLSGDSVAAGLANNPYPSLAEMLLLATQVRRCLPQVQAPCLILHASHDDVADIRTNAQLVAQRVGGPATLIALQDSYHMITVDRQRRDVVRHTVEFFQSIVAAQATQPSLAAGGALPSPGGEPA